MTLPKPKPLHKSPLRSSTLQHLTELCGRLSEERPGMAGRLAKAYDLVASARVTPCAAVPGDVLIPGAKGEVYRVGAGRCECADAIFRGLVCKHRLGRRLYFVAQAEEARARAQEVTSRRAASLTAEDYVSSGLQLAGVVENEALNYLQGEDRASPPKTLKLSPALGRRCREIETEQAELRRALLCGTADMDWSVEQNDPSERWREWEEAVDDL
jgi:hypothetical protein